MKRVLTILLTAFIAGCTAVESPETSIDSSVEQLTFKLLFVDSNFEPIADYQHHENVIVRFPIIPGGLFGAVLTHSIYTAEVSPDGQFTMNLEELSDEITSYATPLLSNPYNQDFLIAPHDTKLLRLGTFANSARTNQGIGGTGIGHLTDSGLEKFVLVYFDRASQLVGISDAYEEVSEYDISVDGPGFVFLKQIEIGPDHYKYVAEKLVDNVYIFIVIDDFELSA